MPAPGEDLGTMAEDRYELVRVLGRGGMATVYQAWDTRLDLHRAIKILEPAMLQSQAMRERFDREARVMARLRHPHILAVHDIGEEEGKPYIIMELLTGGTLADLVEECGGLDPLRALTTCRQVLEALEFAHGQGVVHRDIKPENVLLDEQGSAKVMDLGIARWTTDPRDLTRTGSVLGTWAYMAPELRTDATRAGVASDVFAVGAMLFACLTCRPPFDLYASDLRSVHFDGVPVSLHGLIQRATAYEPSQRYPSARAMIEAVDDATASIGGQGEPGLPDEPPVPPEPASVAPTPAPARRSPGSAETLVEEPPPAGAQGSSRENVAVGWSPRVRLGAGLAAGFVGAAAIVTLLWLWEPSLGERSPPLAGDVVALAVDDGQLIARRQQAGELLHRTLTDWPVPAEATHGTLVVPVYDFLQEVGEDSNAAQFELPGETPYGEVRSLLYSAGQAASPRWFLVHDALRVGPLEPFVIDDGLALSDAMHTTVFLELARAGDRVVLRASVDFALDGVDPDVCASTFQGELMRACLAADPSDVRVFSLGSPAGGCLLESAPVPGLEWADLLGPALRSFRFDSDTGFVLAPQKTTPFSTVVAVAAGVREAGNWPVQIAGGLPMGEVDQSFVCEGAPTTATDLELARARWMGARANGAEDSGLAVALIGVRSR